MTDFSKKYQVVIAYHETLPCYVGEHIKEYLLDKYRLNLLLIGHPLLENGESYKRSSRFEYYQDSKLFTKQNAFHWIAPMPGLVLISMIYTFIWCLKTPGKWDTFFGIDNSNVLVALVLKRIGKIKKVIYHPMDYFSPRFENKFLDWLYFQLDKICVQSSDETWNVSEGMILAREKKMGMKRDAKQRVFPICVWVNKVRRKPFNQINKKKIIFRGSLTAEMGVDLIIKAMPKILKVIPNISLEIFGDGVERKKLESDAKKLKVSKYVKFFGWIREREQLEEKMSDAALGIATFNTNIAGDKFRNADPGKIKDYMLMGMTIITTKAISNFEGIQKAKAGIIINYETSDLADAVIRLLSDEKLLQEYRDNALLFIKQFDCGKLFDENISRVLN